MDLIESIIGHKPHNCIKAAEAKIMFKEDLDNILADMIIFPDIVDDYYEECKANEKPIFYMRIFLVEKHDYGDELQYRI